MKKKLFSEIPYIVGKTVTLRKITREDAPDLQKMVNSPLVYRYLPTFLFEKKYDDIFYVIDHLYDECFQESIILGVQYGNRFCGLAEMHGYSDHIHKISIGCRLMEEFWGKGICTETIGLMVRYLYEETDIEIITASTMLRNKGSARALEKNGFSLVAHAAPEDWGYENPTPSDKWIK